MQARHSLVQKPEPNDRRVLRRRRKTVSKPAVLGTAPDDGEEVRIVIFQPMAEVNGSAAASITATQACFPNTAAAS